MGRQVRIKRVYVEGLHQQFDVDLSFNSGLNIIYGKNGTGKTTVLHLIANALECDFKRFSFLQFNRILMENDVGGIVEIAKEQASTYPTVKINGKVVAFSETNPVLSEAELGLLREVLGGRPTYLPAFRSVLERVRADQSVYYRHADRRDTEFEEMVQREVVALKERIPLKANASPYEQRQQDDEATATAQKSTLCRQWFGRFVPAIRYPSVSEVEDALTEEWRSANLSVSLRERRMFEEIFIKVFRTIAGLEKTTGVENNDDLLKSIENLLKNQDSELESSESNNIYNLLLEAVKKTDTSVVSRGVDNSLLDIYRQVLEKRNMERRSAFQRARDFEASVNKFLERKTFRIGAQRSTTGSRMRSAVSIVNDMGHSYGISELSSGERQILTMLYSASRTKFLSGVFLIDEPELSLHIDWQRIILRELQTQSPDCQIIACTHSPEVGADHVDAIQDFEPKPSAVRQTSLFPEES